MADAAGSTSMVISIWAAAAAAQQRLFRCVKPAKLSTHTGVAAQRSARDAARFDTAPVHPALTDNRARR
jgi:hypothetical protein